VPDLAFTPDSLHLASAGASDPAIRLWEVAGDKPPFEIRHNSQPNSAVDLSPDGRLIAAPAREQPTAEPTIHIWEVDWDAKTYKQPPLHILRGHVGYVWKVKFSADGRFLASGSWDATVKIWDVKTGKELRTLRGHAGIIYALAFSPDGRRLATGSGSAGHGEVKIWDAALWDEKLGAERQDQPNQTPPAGGGQ
jgi:WD40 repeat protein